MSEEIKETLDDIKRHLDYVEATKQSSIRDNEMKIMYDYIASLQQKVEQLENIRKEAIKFINEWLFEAGGNGADMDYDTIVDLLNILNKGSDKE